jgi:hypothetical protein
MAYILILYVGLSFETKTYGLNILPKMKNIVCFVFVVGNPFGSESLRR